MVLTCGRATDVSSSGAAAGTAVGVTAVGGCGLFDDDPDPAPAPDALQPLLDEAVALAAGVRPAPSPRSPVLGTG